MPCLLLIIGLVFPRVTLVLLLLFSHWLQRAFDGVLLLVLGFIFVPYTTLWYSVVMNVYHGHWGFWQILFMVVALVTDLSASGGAARRRAR
jgi:hypothetical protein